MKEAKKYFNPRSLAGATLIALGQLFNAVISIHAPLRERPIVAAMIAQAKQFQSTLPCGSDITLNDVPTDRVISIHAPLRERPAQINPFIIYEPYFNPRSLAGATYHTPQHMSDQRVFQSTLPCGSDSASHSGVNNPFAFQSTLPCGSDPSFNIKRHKWRYFNPRSLTGATLMTA